MVVARWSSNSWVLTCVDGIFILRVRKTLNLEMPSTTYEFSCTNLIKLSLENYYFLLLEHDVKLSTATNSNAAQADCRNEFFNLFPFFFVTFLKNQKATTTYKPNYTTYEADTINSLVCQSLQTSECVSLLPATRSVLQIEFFPASRQSAK